MSDVSAVTNMIPTVNEGFITTVSSPGVSSGGTTVPLANVSGLTNGSVFIGVVDPTQVSKQTFTGIVDTSGSQITNVVWTLGTNAAHAVGATVVDWITGTAINLLSKAFLVSHGVTGTLNSAAIAQVLDNGRTASLRVTPRVSSTTSATTLTPNIDSYNIYDLSAQAANLTIANPTGTPSNGDGLIIRIKDNGTSRTISYGANFSNISGVTSLSATVLGKWHVIGALYNASVSKWQIVSISTEA